MDSMKVERRLTKTEVKSKLLLLGKGFPLPTGIPLDVTCGGKTYRGRTHTSTVGRIDSLSALYEDFHFQEGDTVRAVYEPLTGTVALTSVGDADADSPDELAFDFSDFFDAPPAPEAKPSGEAKDEAKRRLLEGAFAQLDPVVFHWERYQYGWDSYRAPTHMFLNRNWIIYEPSSYPKSEYCLIDENGKNETALPLPLNLTEKEYEQLEGFNSCGVWFSVRNRNYMKDDGDGAMWKVLCVNPVSNHVSVYRVNRKKGYIWNLYICGKEVWYIVDVTENKQAVCRADEQGEEEVFYTRKGQKIDRLSVGQDKIAFRLEQDSDKEVSECWLLMDKATRQFAKIGVTPEDPNNPQSPLISILQVDLWRNVMYTSVTEREASRFGVGTSAVAIRGIAEPQEMRMYTFTKDKSPAIWNISSSNISYLDGGVCYYAPHYSVLERYNPQGEKFKLDAKEGHGCCDAFLVNDRYVFCNYDAYDTVRLPRLFSGRQGFAKDNPEAFFILGQHKDFRM